ncbi:hypothetical protein BVRB_8g202080 isoform A [Beta vulgaris subsp. vulgaris]|uniref:Uncharacterized protein n=1 Tax=Beta vulgaris subsp. vulgaris TaxID=3555 RepID=A0A0J8B989_BETVV|nr:hypothetical protein BVRB_8g202080 isoform A [Beta vulgaris subsp. vulgaris]
MDENSKVIDVRPPWLLHQWGHSLTLISQNANEKREKVVKASRDITMNSKKVIFQLVDLTGELMRLAISRISDGELHFADKICRFVRDVHRELTLVVPAMDDSHDMKTKMEIMLQSVMKIENACVRGSEYIPLIGSNDPSFALMGVPDMEPWSIIGLINSVFSY